MANVIGPQLPVQMSATETYSKNILGPVWFKLSNLTIAGTNTMPAAPEQSPYIIASNEQFTISVDIEFNNTPLTELVLCLGMELVAEFGIEGFGKDAEVDLSAEVVITKKGELKYTLSYTGTPDQAGLTPGFYQAASVVKIGPAKHPCSQKVLGYGYIGEIRFQVYQA
jgi:hypothetical protein